MPQLLLITTCHVPAIRCRCAEMNLNAGDVWGHFAPMFHLVDVFAIYAITLVSCCFSESL